MQRDSSMENRCIICREETDSFSDEHVIPDTLGGYYHIYTVCKDCNSDLGSDVDSKLVNHRFADFQSGLTPVQWSLTFASFSCVHLRP